LSAIPAGEPFVADERKREGPGITPRELNTVKTHPSRLFDKLGSQRRTQAVQIGKTARLIP